PAQPAAVLTGRPLDSRPTSVAIRNFARPLLPSPQPYQGIGDKGPEKLAHFVTERKRNSVRGLIRATRSRVFFSSGHPHAQEQLAFTRAGDGARTRDSQLGRLNSGAD